ncbi:MAG: c-type cytochrome [Candidatus Acidiferrales bacterium]
MRLKELTGIGMLTFVLALMTVAAVRTWAQAAPQAPRPRVPATQSPASQAPPPTATPQAYPQAQVDAGQAVFQQNCAFCHGRDAGGGETGPDLTRSPVVAADVRGDQIGPVVHGGRVDKGMPSFNLSDQDLAAVVAFIHDQKTKADSEQGGRQHVSAEDLATGNAEAGKAFFDGGGKCTTCHSATGDLAGVATRLQGLTLLQRMLYPAGGRSAAPVATVTVTQPDGKTITGNLAYRDEFTIALRDVAGRYRSWPTSEVKYTVNDPLQAHVELLGKYTDDEMHNVLAYLQTLK